MSAAGTSPSEARRIRRPVFVIGCNNSGTTILWRALAAHPELASHGREGQLIDGLPSRFGPPLDCAWRLWASRLMRVGGRSMLDLHARTEHDVVEADADRLDHAYARALGDSGRLVEKSPPNTIRTRYLQAVFPDATFVGIVRAPLPVVEGICRTNERLGSYGLGSVALAADHWASANGRLLEDSAHLRRLLLLRYDDLVNDPAATLAHAFEFIGVAPPWPLPPDMDRDRDARQASRLPSRARRFAAFATGEVATRLDVAVDRSAPGPGATTLRLARLAAQVTAARIVLRGKVRRGRVRSARATP